MATIFRPIRKLTTCVPSSNCWTDGGTRACFNFSKTISFQKPFSTTTSQWKQPIATSLSNPLPRRNAPSSSRNPTSLQPTGRISPNPTPEANLKTSSPKSQAKRPPEPLTSPPVNTLSSPSSRPRVSSLSRAGPGRQRSMDLLLRHKDIVLLYRAPGNHRWYSVFCFGLGVSFLVGAYTCAKLYSDEFEDQDGMISRAPWYLRLLLSVPVVFMSIAAFRFFTAPSRIIRSITLVAPKVPGLNTHGVPILRCEAHNPLPYMGKKVIEISPLKLMADKKLADFNTSARSFPYYNMKLEHVSFSTKAELEKEMRMESTQSVKPGIWATIKLQIDRVFYGRGFFDIKFPVDGYWRVDVLDAYVLDHAQPLFYLTSPMADRDRSWWSRWTTLLR